MTALVARKSSFFNAASFGRPAFSATEQKLSPAAGTDWPEYEGPKQDDPERSKTDSFLDWLQSTLPDTITSVPERSLAALEIVTLASSAFVQPHSQMINFPEAEQQFRREFLLPQIRLHDVCLRIAGPISSDTASRFGSWRVLRRSGCQEFWTPFERRFSELLQCAIEEEIQIKWRSEREMRAFLGAAGALALPGLFLLDDGTFRLIWQNEQGEQIGLQFLGNGRAQYVIFVRMRGGSGINSAVGQHDVAALPLLIEGYGAWRLLYQ